MKVNAGGVREDDRWIKGSRVMWNVIKLRIMGMGDEWEVMLNIIW